MQVGAHPVAEALRQDALNVVALAGERLPALRQGQGPRSDSRAWLGAWAGAQLLLLHNADAATAARSSSAHSSEAAAAARLHRVLQLVHESAARGGGGGAGQ